MHLIGLHLGTCTAASIECLDAYGGPFRSISEFSFSKFLIVVHNELVCCTLYYVLP